MSVAMVGWSHSQFGKLDNESLEDLIIWASASAIADAGLEPKDIDAIFIGTVNAGLDEQDFPSSLILQLDREMRFLPSTRVENACATGSAALYQGISAIRAQTAKRVLVVGVEKMTTLPNAAVMPILLRATYRKEEKFDQGGFAAVFEQIQAAYFQRYGDKSEATATIAAKNHKNGSLNPLAHVQKDFGFEFCNTISEKNPLVVGQLRRTDCSMVSDGAAAVVLTDVDTALSMEKAVVFRAAQHVNDFLPMSSRDVVKFEGPATAWSRALREAGVSLSDLSMVETHDCFTIAELIQYEAMGLTEPGDGARAALEGWTQRDGKLPVNVSGGLKAKGHPLGATGVSMHVVSAMQLTGQAGAIQLPKAQLAGVFNMGGAAVANYCSILEALRA